MRGLYAGVGEMWTVGLNLKQSGCTVEGDTLWGSLLLFPLKIRNCGGHCKSPNLPSLFAVPLVFFFNFFFHFLCSNNNNN